MKNGFNEAFNYGEKREKKKTQKDEDATRTQNKPTSVGGGGESQ